MSLFFYSEKENYFYYFSPEGFILFKNGTGLPNGNRILTNIYVNDTENIKITIKNKKIEEKEEEKEKEEDEPQNKTTNYFNRNRKTSSGLSKAAVVLISVLVPVGLIGVVIAAIALTRKATTMPNIREHNNKMDSITNLKY